MKTLAVLLALQNWGSSHPLTRRSPVDWGHLAEAILSGVLESILRCRCPALHILEGRGLHCLV